MSVILSELRDSVEKLKHVLIATPSGAQIPLGQIADIVLRTGPSMIRNENGLLAGYVYVDVAGRDIGSYVDEAKRARARESCNCLKAMACFGAVSMRICFGCVRG